ncbi:hypothetical protein ANCDUO_07581 [Ancylostoma duodenale]|uniref:Uncharacterized protein n=1 Tax=Ancylostoma duodenale TaxID=51022 RepID=A0A0C2GT19_9BILA|nr:hypothetical protein ANCDUO_07581 [Ancylostoma duodenale]
MQDKKISYDVIGLAETRRHRPLNAAFDSEEELAGKLDCAKNWTVDEERRGRRGVTEASSCKIAGKTSFKKTVKVETISLV